MANPNRKGKAGPVGSSGETENAPKASGLTNAVYKNRGAQGGRDMGDIVGAEKVSVAGVDFAKKGGK